MELFVAPIGLAIVAFVSTNIGDLFVLVTFLVDRHFTVRDVVIGRYVGMGGLYAISSIAALISLVLPPAYALSLRLVESSPKLYHAWHDLGKFA
jgi:cadmium resistance protein CadD (predicted permease)